MRASSLFNICHKKNLLLIQHIITIAIELSMTSHWSYHIPITLVTNISNSFSWVLEHFYCNDVVIATMSLTNFSHNCDGKNEHFVSNLSQFITPMSITIVMGTIVVTNRDIKSLTSIQWEPISLDVNWMTAYHRNRNILPS